VTHSTVEWEVEVSDAQDELPGAWVCVAAADEVPSVGDMVTRDVDGTPVIVVRRGDGELVVLSAICPHRGMIVEPVDGWTGRQLRCPYHFWSFDFSGRCLGTRGMPPLMNGRCDLDVVPHELRDDAVYVAIQR